MIRTHNVPANPPALSDHEVIARVPAEVYPYSAGLEGGLAGGIGMIAVGLVYGLMSSHGVWYPVNLIAATVIRPWQAASPAQLEQFSALGLVVGLAIHLLMSMGLGLLYGALLPALPGNPLLWALLVGPILWAGAVFAGLPLLNPAMARLVDLPSFAVANIVYSLILGTWIARTPKISVEY